MFTNNFGKCDDLQQELEDAKDNLVVLNDNIKRIVGRTCLNKNSRSIELNNEKTTRKFQHESFKSKKNTKSVFKRLSSPATRYKDSKVLPRLTSRVIRELPSRQEIVAVQCTDSESRSRNRRMFGSLLGTLHKFCQEESRLKQQEEKRAQIEKKLEEQEILERESLKKERETLFIDRKRKQMEIKRLELKMSRIKDYETWEQSIKHLKNFIKTETVPNIYYRPKVLSKITENLLKESVAHMDEIIQRKREDLKINISKIEDIEAEYDNSRKTKLHFDEIHGVFQGHFSISRNVLASSISVIKDTKCNLDSKENKIRNSGEKILSSSIAAAHH